jgi:hypothetical protein
MNQHKEELTNTLLLISKENEYPPKKSSPLRHSIYIWGKISSCLVNDWCDSNSGINHSIRQIHDYYGWMAKDGIKGKCRGTIYRTKEFIKINPWDRDGSKKESRNIHIEHTVPVAVLQKFLKRPDASYKHPRSLHLDLIHHSVCVAMSHQEQLSMRNIVPNSSNTAFDKNGDPIDNRPFLRYKALQKQNPDFRIINTMTGDEISLEKFTFDDHVKTLQLASSLITEDIFLYDLEIDGRNSWLIDPSGKIYK